MVTVSRIKEQAITVNCNARRIKRILLRFIALTGPAIALWYLAPALWGLLETRIVRDLEKQLREVPPDEASLVLERISEIGPRGSPALVRALTHPDDAVFSQARRILWQKSQAWNAQAVDHREVLVTIRELNRVFPQLTATRRQSVAELIDHFLAGYRESGAYSPQILQLCESMLTIRTEVSQLSNGHSLLPEAKALNPKGNSAATVMRFDSSPPAAGVASGNHTPPTPGPSSLGAMTKSPMGRAPLRETPAAVVDNWQLPQNELAAWKEIIVTPVAERTIYEEGSDTIQRPSRSFGPGGLATASRPQPEKERDEGWKSTGTEVMVCDIEEISGTNRDVPPTSAQSDLSSLGPAPFDASKAVELPAGKRLELTMLEPLFCQLSRDDMEAEQARHALQSLRLSAAMIEAGRMAFHPDSGYRRQAVRAIWELSGIDPLPFLFRLAKDSDPDVRREALAVLATVSSPQVRSFVQEAVSHDTDPLVQGLFNGRDIGNGQNNRKTTSGKTID
ncbi:MAG: HEAT repeat domain-containing protein [Thermogutta sp.]